MSQGDPSIESRETTYTERKKEKEETEYRDDDDDEEEGGDSGNAPNESMRKSPRKASRTFSEWGGR